MQLESSLSTVQEMIVLGEAVQRLKKNKDFKKVVLEAYFSSEPQRLTMLLAAPNIRNDMRTQVHESLQAIAEFHSFLETILTESVRAKDMVGEIEDVLVEARTAAGE